MGPAAVALALALAGISGGGATAAQPPLPAESGGLASAVTEGGIVSDWHPLFDGSVVVPRGRAHDRFTVRNTSGDVAYLRVVLLSVDVPDAALRRSLSVAVSTARGSGALVPLDSAGGCVPLLAPQPVARGAAVDVDAMLAMGDLTGTTGQAGPIGFSLLVVLDADSTAVGCGAGGGGRPPGEAAGPPGAPLAATGSDILAAVWSAAMLTGAGAAGVRAARGQAGARRGVGVRRGTGGHGRPHHDSRDG